jgi:uncharacterized protein (DUF934 family)
MNAWASRVREVFCAAQRSRLRQRIRRSLDNWLRKYRRQLARERNKVANMLRSNKERRKLQRNSDIDRQKLLAAGRKVAEARRAGETAEQLSALRANQFALAVRVQSNGCKLRMFDSGVILRRARLLAVEVPTFKDKPTWWENDYEDGMPDEAVSQWLSEVGQIGTKKLIRLERRANF